jgi:fatty-acid desaturase
MDDNWYVCMVSELLAEFSIGGKELVLWSILSMVLAVHAESLTNSAGHLYGSRPFQCQFHSNCDVTNAFYI